MGEKNAKIVNQAVIKGHGVFPCREKQLNSYLLLTFVWTSAISILFAHAIKAFSLKLTNNYFRKNLSASVLMHFFVSILNFHLRRHPQRPCVTETYTLSHTHYILSIITLMM